MANKTVYVHNLYDRASIEDLKTALRTLFEGYGNILDIVAKSNLKSKGQVFVVFDDAESAAKAINDIDGFVLFDKPMRCAFAKTRSDATVKQEGSKEEVDEHVKERMANKELKKARQAQESKKRPAPTDEAIASGAQPPKKGLKSTGGTKATVVPEEYLPPNKILFVRNLPPDYDADDLTPYFQRFPGFKEVRIVPGRAGIAFVEYQSEEGAIQAKKSTGGMEIGGNTISVFFQRS